VRITGHRQPLPIMRQKPTYHRHYCSMSSPFWLIVEPEKRLERSKKVCQAPRTRPTANRLVFGDGCSGGDAESLASPCHTGSAADARQSPESMKKEEKNADRQQTDRHAGTFVVLDAPLSADVTRRLCRAFRRNDAAWPHAPLDITLPTVRGLGYRSGFSSKQGAYTLAAAAAQTPTALFGFVDAVVVAVVEECPDTFPPTARRLVSSRSCVERSRGRWVDAGATGGRPSSRTCIDEQTHPLLPLDKRFLVQS
jgi:hypothetical protein